MARGPAGAFVVVALLLGMPAAVADVVVDGTQVTATASDGRTTAEVTLINTGESAATLTGMTVTPECVVTPRSVTLQPRQSTTVTLELDSGCPSGETVVVDLDGSDGPLPEVTVKPAQPATTSLTPWWTGVQFAAVAALVTLVVGFLAFRTARGRVENPSATDVARRAARYQLLTSLVGERMTSLGADDVRWVPLPAQTYGLSAKVANLKAGWSFQESWVTSLTAVTSAVIALASSSDLFTSLLGEAPEGALRVPAVAALAAAALIAVAVLVVKLLGSDADEVTVGGLVLSTALVAAAAVLNVITASVTAAELLEPDVWSQSVRFAGFGVAALLAVYAARSLWQAVVGGAAEPVPAIPGDAVQAWATGAPWQRSVVLARLRADYGEFLSTQPEATASAPMTPTELMVVGLEPARGLTEPVASLI